MSKLLEAAEALLAFTRGRTRLHTYDKEFQAFVIAVMKTKQSKDVPEDTQILDWIELNCEGCVRGTDYPEWRLQGEEQETLREAARAAMKKAAALSNAPTNRGTAFAPGGQSSES